MSTEIQNPESLALLARVQEMFDKDREVRNKMLDEINAARVEVRDALSKVAAGFQAPVAAAPQPDGHNGQAAPAVPDAVHETALQAAAQDKEGMRKVIERRIYDALGMPTWEPARVSFTKDQALAAIAAGRPTTKVLSVAERGLSAIGVEAAFERGLVQAPKKGLSGWQIAGLAIAGTVATAGAVAGGMYLAEVGPFAPKTEPLPPTEG
jgi:hypothetical protein